MRLIDADKINFNQDDTEVVFEVLHAEPIEAIPVEWLLNHTPHDEPMERYNKKLIEYLVIGWRKENG